MDNPRTYVLPTMTTQPIVMAQVTRHNGNALHPTATSNRHLHLIPIPCRFPPFPSLNLKEPGVTLDEGSTTTTSLCLRCLRPQPPTPISLLLPELLPL
jgi:hypothetical protein